MPKNSKLLLINLYLQTAKKVLQVSKKSKNALSE